jgi:hypothetical protein
MTNPTDGQTDVPVGANIAVEFSERVIGYEGANVTLTRVSNGENVPLNRGYNVTTNRLTLYPYGATGQKLVPGAEYRVTLSGGPTAIRSVSGVPLETQSFTFTTAAPPAPTVVGATPGAGDTGVPIGTSVTVEFSERVTGYGGANVTLTRVSNGENVPLNRGYNVTTNRLTLYPYGATGQKLVPGAVYRVTLSGGPTAIRSVSGVPLETQSFTFTTSP